MPTRPLPRAGRIAALLTTAALVSGAAACGTSTADDRSATPRAAVTAPSSPTTASTTATPATTGTSPVSGQTALGTERTVTRDGHDIAFYVTPGHGASIVLDAGGGDDASYWNALVPRIAAGTGAEVITYDRTGAGLSDDVPGPFEAAASAEDLAAGLDQLALPDAPIVLASHSLAGEVATALVDAHPDLVDGAVLVDANVPQFFTPEETGRLVAANDAQLPAVEAAPQTRQTRQLLAVAEDYGPAHLAFHRLTWPQTIPVDVIVSEATPFPAGSDDAQRWRDAEQAFASAAANRHLVTADHSSHDVALDRPDVVLAQVGDVLHRL